MNNPIISDNTDEVTQKGDDSNHELSRNEKDRAICSNQVSSSITTMERSSMEIDQKCSSSVHDNQCQRQAIQDDKLKSTKLAEMGEVKQENEKLKLTLSKIMKAYNSLQTQFDKIVQKDTPTNYNITSLDTIASTKKNEVGAEEPAFVSLSLGRFPSEEEPKKKEDISNKDQYHDQGLELGLDCNFYQSSAAVMKKSNDITSPVSSLNESNEETTSKSVKTARSGEDEITQQSPNLKKARVSVRAICNTATMNDGCQWRKYGQKIAKGNPCPRAYYRCTISSSCPVRKHVQRCAHDMSILITTYEGTHNHPLPVSATAMASTTSAAASMLNSTSSTSQSGLGPTTTTTASANLHGLNFTHPSSQSIHHPFYFPKTTISTTQSHPTVTLDLTAPTVTTDSRFNRTSTLSSSLYSSQQYTPTCLDFSSYSSNDRNFNGYSYFNAQKIQEQSYNSYQPNTIEAATKDIASNPKFRSVLAAAITSFVGNTREKNSVMESSAFPLNLGQYSSPSNYLNRFPGSNSQEGNLTLFPSLLQLSATKKSSVSSIDEGDNVK